MQMCVFKGNTFSLGKPLIQKVKPLKLQKVEVLPPF
jgi:hypothetical protein